MHSGNRVQRVSSRVTLSNFGALSAQTYQWRIPLIKNPESSGKPLRMNLTVWQYKDTYSGIGARCLFYEIINHKKTKIANTISELEYTFINSAGNMIQKNNINMGVSFTSQTIDSD